MELPPSTISCVRCSERKVKCDKKQPCNSCIRHNTECIFRTRKPAKRKRRAMNEEAALVERLKHYENLLRQKGFDPEQVMASPGTASNEHADMHDTLAQVITPASTTINDPTPTTTAHTPKLLQGQQGTKLVDNSLWYRVAEEIDSDESYNEDDNTAEATHNTSDSFTYILSTTPSTTTLSHPTTTHIHQLFKIFLSNVNPLTKLIHVPTLQPAIERAAQNTNRIPAGFSALMFSIYSMAILSLTETQCQSTLSQSRAVLLPQYIHLTEKALSRAKFTSTTSLVVLQALILHLFSIRDTHEPRAVWSLTGLVMRIATAIGLSIDGTHLSLSPFQSEIRRRIWWQLQAHDSRSAELAGQVKFVDFNLDSTTPHPPTNVNDTELSPTMTADAVSSDKPTEMLWLMFRVDLGQFANTVRSKMREMGKARLTQETFGDIDDVKMKDAMTGDIINMIETKYLRFCDPAQPLQFMTLLGGRVAINIVKFMSHHPRRWAKMKHISDSERQYVWDVSTQLLELYNMQQTIPSLWPFAWNVAYHIQWHAVIHVLDTVCAEPFHAEAVKGWRLIDALYENNLEMLLRVDRPIYVAVGSLCLKAFNACVAASARSESDKPPYIGELRDQREAARAKQQRVSVKGKSQQTTDLRKNVGTNEAIVLRLDNNVGPTIALARQSLLGETGPQSTNAAQEIARTQDYAFGSNSSLDDDVFNTETLDLMDLDMNTNVVQDFWLDGSDDSGVDWAQWDRWFGGGEQQGSENPSKSG